MRTQGVLKFCWVQVGETSRLEVASLGALGWLSRFSVPTSAQVIISRLVGLSSASPESLDLVGLCVSLSLSASPPLALFLKNQINIKRKFLKRSCKSHVPRKRRPRFFPGTECSFPLVKALHEDLFVAPINVESPYVIWGGPCKWAGAVGTGEYPSLSSTDLLNSKWAVLLLRL